MTERYKIIKQIEHKEWLAESRVKIERSQLLFDNQSNKIILQVKLFNLSDKMIKAVFLDVDCFDAANDFLFSINDAVIQGVEAKPRSNFGNRQPIILEHSNTSNIKITISKVVFIDDNVWRNEEKNPGKVLPEQKTIDQDDPLYGQLIRECSEKNIKPVYWFETTDNYWRCTCGQPNKLDLLQCGYCQAEKNWLGQCFNKQYLLEANERFLESEVIRKIDDKKRQEELDNQAKAKKKKQKIVTSIAALVCVIIAVSLIILNTPTARAERQLNIGNKYLQDEKYQAAILAFQKVIQINPNNIPAREGLFKIYLMEGNIDDADGVLKEITLIEPNKDIKQLNFDLDSARAIIASKESYDQGLKQMSDKQYLEAVDSFQKVIKEDAERHTDAQTKINDCKKIFIDENIQKAKDAASNKDYQKSLNLLEQILKIDPNNQDALKLKSEYIQVIETNKPKKLPAGGATNKPKKLSAEEATKIMNAYDSGYITANETDVTVDGKQVYCFVPIGGNMFQYAVDAYSGVIYVSEVTPETKNLGCVDYEYYLKKIQ